MLWTVALLTTGTVGGVLYNWPARELEANLAGAAQVEAAPKPKQEPSRGLSLTSIGPKETPPDPIELEPLRLGDRLLLGGNHIGAYQQYGKLKNQTSGSPDPSLLLRLGIASELAGFHEQAEGYYRDVIQTPNQSIAQVWAMIAVARIWETRGRLDEAIGLLSELFLLYEAEEYPIELRLPICQQLARCLLKKENGDAAQKLPTSTMLHYWGPAKIEPTLSDQVRLPNDERGDETNVFQVVQRPVADVSLILVDATLSNYSTRQLLDQVATGANLEFAASPQASEILSGRSMRVDATALPVSMLLDQILAPLQLAWEQKGDKVNVYHESELARQQKEDYRLDRIQRTLRQLQMNFEGTERVAALMHDGNIHFMRGEYEHAENKYRAARELVPTGELNARLYFNTALLSLQQSDREGALDLFYQALDQSLSPKLQSVAYTQIAQLELELGRPAKAIPAASRGLRLDRDAGRDTRILLTLAKSYLLESDPYSANQILFDNASSVDDPASKRLAGVISTYARFQVVKPINGLQNEGERLVLALAAIQSDDPQSFIDHLLISRAFRDVGFRSKAIDHLIAASSLVEGGYWGSRIKFELADLLHLDGEVEKADAVLRSLSRNLDPNLKTQVGLLAANVQFELGDFQYCRSNCESLLRLGLSDEEKKQTLTILGKVYQQAGKHYAAALCFAGLLPDAVKTGQSQ